MDDIKVGNMVLTPYGEGEVLYIHENKCSKPYRVRVGELIHGCSEKEVQKVRGDDGHE